MKKIVTLIFIFAAKIISAQAPPPPPPPPPPHVERAPGDTTREILSYAEVMPEFAGPGTFSQYLGKNIKYPTVEKEEGKTGTVYISFVVEKDGSITNVKPVKEVPGAPGFTKEAIRVISQMPKWKPGQMNGKPVRVEFTQPIKFWLDNGASSSPSTTLVTKPSFPGGDSALTAYIKQNLKYPAKDKKHHKEGKVVISFIVESDGSVSDIEVMPGADATPAMINEAKRLVAAMPKWNPGTRNGIPTRMFRTLSVEFKL